MNKEKTFIKVPLILSERSDGSGAACLAMVLAYHGLDVGTDGLNSVCDTNRYGEETDKLIYIARGFGFDAVAQKIQVTAVKELKVPSIVRMRSGEYAVYNGYSGNRIVLTKPHEGVIKVKEDAFADIFSGESVSVAISNSFTPGEKKDKATSFIKAEVQNNLRSLLIIGICSILVCVIALFFPSALRVFADRVIPGYDNWMTGVVLALILGGLISLILMGIKAWELYKLSAKLSVNTDEKLFKRMQKLSSTYYSMHTSGEVQELLSLSRKLSGQVASCIVPFAVYFIVLVFYMMVALLYSPLAALPGVCALLINVGLGVLLYFKGDNIAVESYLRSKVRDMRVAELENCAETLGRNGYGKVFNKRKSEKVQHQKLFGFLNVCVKALARLSYVLTAVIGVALILNGSETAGVAIAIVCITCMAFADIEKVFGRVMLFNEMKSQATFIDDFLRYPMLDETDKYDINGEVQFEKVSFGYSALEKPILENISFKASKGKRYAVVGDGGVGKTTLIKLVCGLVTPWDGDILYDGRSVYETRSALENSAVYVSASPVIFHATIRENLRMFDSRFSDYDILAASQKSGLSYMLYSFENGLDYELSEDKRRLTDGEKQLIELTRIFLFSPKIVALDNAFCAFTASREAQLLTRLKNEGMTVFLVSNRAETVAFADGVLYIKNGKISAKTHAEFMTGDRDYQRLFM